MERVGSITRTVKHISKTIQPVFQHVFDEIFKTASIIMRLGIRRDWDEGLERYSKAVSALVFQIGLSWHRWQTCRARIAGAVTDFLGATMKVHPLGPIYIL